MDERDRDDAQDPLEAWPRAEEQDPAAMLAMVEQERHRTAQALEPDARILYGVWGGAWLIGFLLLWGTVGGRPVPPLVGGLVFFLLLLTGVVVTIVHTTRRVSGVVGVSRRVGAMYGWSWTLGFAALTAVMAGAARAGADPELLALLWPVLSGLVVGLLYLGAGALWQDRIQYGLGLWVLVSSAAGALAGFPAVYLVMALAGGGGFLLAAAWFVARGRRSR